MFDRNTVIALILIFVIFLGWSWYMQLTAPPQPVNQTAADSIQVKQDTISKPVVPVASTQQSATMAVDTGVVAVDTIPVREISIKTRRYRMTLTNRGGGISRLEFTQYKHGSTGMVEMVSPGGDAVPTVMSTISGFTDKEIVFSSDDSDFELSDNDAPRTVSFKATIAGRGEITKSYTFYPDRYDFDLKLTINGAPQLGLDKEYVLAWIPGIRSSEANLNDDYSNFMGGAHMADEMYKINDFSDGKLSQDLSGQARWVGARSKYFMYAFIPGDHENNGGYFRGTEKSRVGPSGNYTQREISTGIIMASGANQSVSHGFKVFVGPLDYNLLKGYNVGLQDFISWGWKIIHPFSIAIYWVTHQLGRLIPNYGIVIIIMALLIKVVTFPLTRKSLKSMNAMRRLAPKMDEIRAKYKSDPAKLNQAVMKLYKEEKVNPFSGCLLLLPQMPLLYGLYTVFSSTIEFRQAAFMPPWLDLSLPDHLYIMPILMTVAMFFQQKMSVTDPKQKFMVYLFPAMFFFFMFSLPVGLVLYWTVYSVLSIVEQIYIKRQDAQLNPQVR